MKLFKYSARDLSDKYIVLFRAHHQTTKVLGIKYNDFIRNVSDYPQVNDLMIVVILFCFIQGKVTLLFLNKKKKFKGFLNRRQIFFLRGINGPCIRSFFSPGRSSCIAIFASWRKNALFALQLVLPDEKTHRRRRRQAFLTKKRTVVADDRASWRKNASSSPTTGLPGEKTHRRRRRQGFLAKIRSVVGLESPSRPVPSANIL